MKKLLTVKEAAALLGITERAAWMRIYRKELPHTSSWWAIGDPASEPADARATRRTEAA